MQAARYPLAATSDRMLVFLAAGMISGVSYRKRQHFCYKPVCRKARKVKSHQLSLGKNPSHFKEQPMRSSRYAKKESMTKSPKRPRPGSTDGRNLSRCSGDELADMKTPVGCLNFHPYLHQCGSWGYACEVAVIGHRLE